MTSSSEKPNQSMPAARAGRRRRTLAPDDPIAAGLQRMWADAEQEPVPDDLMALLDRIDEAGIDEAGAATSDGDTA